MMLGSNGEVYGAFRVGDLFSISRPATRSRSGYADGVTPFVATSEFNNGVTAMVQPKEDECLDVGNCITVSPLNGFAFYQKDDFLGRGGAGSAILILRHDNLDELTGLYIAAVLRNSLTRFSYADQLNSQSIKDETVHLPLGENGEISWEQMRARMRCLLDEAERQIEYLNATEIGRHVIDSRDWQPFPIGGPDGLFTIEKGTRLTRADMREGTTPFIGASTANNGITAYVGNDEHIHPGNVITVAYNGQKATGKAFYQPEPFWASDDVHVLYPNFELNELRALFLLPIFRIVGEPYAFEDKWKVEFMEKDCLPLPVDAKGVPDWEYMECKMGRAIEAAKTSVDALGSL